MVSFCIRPNFFFFFLSFFYFIIASIDYSILVLYAIDASAYSLAQLSLFSSFWQYDHGNMHDGPKICCMQALYSIVTSLSLLTILFPTCIISQPCFAHVPYFTIVPRFPASILLTYHLVFHCLHSVLQVH